MTNYISIDICGGLGNQLFQIATALYYAQIHDHQLVLPNYTVLANNWNEHRHTYWNTLFANCFDIIDANIIHAYQKLKETQYSFNVLPFIDNNVCLVGYYQSPKYVDPIINIFKKNLYSNEQITHKVDEEYSKLCTLYSSDLISIHVRRGDYLQISDVHTNLSDSYYVNAIKRISQTLPVIVFSNDIEYCKKHLPNVITNKLFFVQDLDDFIELLLMSRIKYNIIANSTFSWWAAYLNENPDKRVIAPNNWFGERGPKDYHELYCNNWESI